MADQQRIASLSGCRVLVTGATGFLGSNLLPALRERGALVTGVSRRPQVDGPGLDWVQSDLSDPVEVEALVRAARPDLIYHFAGAVTGAPDAAIVVPTLSLLTSTVYVLQAATAVGCRRIVLAGTLMRAATIGDQLVPGSPYVAAKWAAAAYGRMFHALYHTPVVLPRLAICYGARQDERRVIPYVIRALEHGEAPRLGSGALEADWLYVDDAVEGLVAAGTVAGLEGLTFDLGSGRLLSVRAVVERLFELSGSSRAPVFGAQTDRPLEACDAADIVTTARLLPWRPRTSLDDGLRRTMQWWHEQESHINSLSSRGQ